jgi:hypothetical protein
MLTHQIKRINTAAMLVTNHMGQLFPVLQRSDLDSKTYDKKYYFDKVLAGNFGQAKKKRCPMLWRWCNQKVTPAMEILEIRGWAEFA